MLSPSALQVKTLASFNGHLTIGIAASGIAATATLQQGYIDQPQVIPLFLAGTLGSLLPVLDTDHSKIVRMSFTLIALLTAFLVMLHSIPAAIIFGALTILLAHHLGNIPSDRAWFYGGFITFGYLIHLVLDEIYSIDIMGMSVKRSAFTALKLYTRSSWSTTLSFYLVMLALLAMPPNIAPVLTALSKTIF